MKVFGNTDSSTPDTKDIDLSLFELYVTALHVQEHSRRNTNRAQTRLSATVNLRTSRSDRFFGTSSEKVTARSTPDVEKDVNEIRLQTPGSRRTSPQSLLEMATSSSSLSVSRARCATFLARTSSFIIITRCNLLSRHGNPRSTTSPRDRTNKKKT